MTMNSPDSTKSLAGNRLKVSSLVECSSFVYFITALILINAVTLGLETDSDMVAAYGNTLHLIDKVILLVFTLELALKFYAYRLSFFKSGWNNFDFLIVTIAWVPASGAFAILRSLRILRVLRLLSVVPQMRKVIAAIGHSIPGMSSVISVLFLLFYVAAVMVTKLYGQNSDPQMQEWFGSVGASAYTLFQVMTLESWSMGIVRPTMEIYPWAWAFFLPFIIVTSFAVLNLFIGIIVDSMQTLNHEGGEEDKKESDELISREITLLNDKLDKILSKIENK